ncbi:hypothetical protein MRB53_041716 [Persea americana]|nr:hypothetical protein MRB53_041716 [Persea americana]
MKSFSSSTTEIRWAFTQLSETHLNWIHGWDHCEITSSLALPLASLARVRWSGCGQRQERLHYDAEHSA